MKKFITAVLLAASVALTGCSSLGETKLEQVQTVAQVAFLAKNYESMKESLLELPTTLEEMSYIVEGIDQFEKVGKDIEAMAKGDLSTVVDYATGVNILDRIGTAYNTVIYGLALFEERTGWVVPAEFLQYDALGKHLYRGLGDALKAKRSLKIEGLVVLFKLATETLQIVKSGGIPSVILPHLVPDVHI